MADFQEITPQTAWQMQQQGAVLADIRDDKAFAEQHPVGAFHLTDASLSSFFQQVDEDMPVIISCYHKYVLRWLKRSDEDMPVIISCYHGVKSRHVANYLAQQGYEKVYSLRGGFAGWVGANLPCEKC